MQMGVRREFAFASVFPPSTSICLFTLGLSLAAAAVFSGNTEGASSGICCTDGAIVTLVYILLVERVRFYE